MREDCWYINVCRNKNCDSCIRYSEMRYLMENSGIPKKKQYPQKLTADTPKDIESFSVLAEIKDDIEQFVTNGENLYIMGKNTGNGKTSWAIKLMLKYFDCVWAGNGFNRRGFFIHVPTLLATIKDFDNDTNKQMKDILINTNLVIWDDIAATKLSDYDISQLLLFIDQRELNGLANIFTGNITDKYELIDMLGNRLASRVWNTNTTIVEIYGVDKR